MWIEKALIEKLISGINRLAILLWLAPLSYEKVPQKGWKIIFTYRILPFAWCSGGVWIVFSDRWIVFAYALVEIAPRLKYKTSSPWYFKCRFWPELTCPWYSRPLLLHFANIFWRRRNFHLAPNNPMSTSIRSRWGLFSRLTLEHFDPIQGLFTHSFTSFRKQVGFSGLPKSIMFSGWHFDSLAKRSFKWKVWFDAFFQKIPVYTSSSEWRLKCDPNQAIAEGLEKALLFPWFEQRTDSFDASGSWLEGA